MKVKIKTENKPFKDLEKCAPDQLLSCKVPGGEVSIMCLGRSERPGMAGVKSTKKELEERGV